MELSTLNLVSPDAVARAIGRNPAMPDGLRKVMDLSEKLDVLPNDLSLLRKFISNRLRL